MHQAIRNPITSFRDDSKAAAAELPGSVAIARS